MTETKLIIDQIINQAAATFALIPEEGLYLMEGLLKAERVRRTLTAQPPVHCVFDLSTGLPAKIVTVGTDTLAVTISSSLEENLKQMAPSFTDAQLVEILLSFNDVPYVTAENWRQDLQAALGEFLVYGIREELDRRATRAARSIAESNEGGN